MRNAIAAFILASSIGSAVALATCAHARSPGCDGNPHNLRCQPSDFLDPVFANPSWWTQSRTDREMMIYKCTSPGVVQRPPASWCQAAIRTQLGRRGQ